MLIGILVTVGTALVALALQYGAWRLWNSYRNAAHRADARRERVTRSAQGTAYTGPTYSPWGNEQ